MGDWVRRSRQGHRRVTLTPITYHLSPGTSARDFAFDSLDEPIHAEELFVGHGLAFRHADLAGLVRDWSSEDGVDGFLAALEAGDLFLNRRPDIFRDEVGDRGQVDDAVLPATPVLL